MKVDHLPIGESSRSAPARKASKHEMPFLQVCASPCQQERQHMVVDSVTTICDLPKVLQLWTAVLRTHRVCCLVSVPQEVGESGARARQEKPLKRTS